MGFIYKISTPLSNKVYIGQTKRSVEVRWKEHIKQGGNTQKEKEHFKLYQAFQKYGIDNFVIDTIEEVDNNILNEREIYWINYYDSFNNGYNSTPGGSNLDIALESWYRPIEKRDLSGNLLETYKCIADAERELNRGKVNANIIKCCKKQMHEAYGYKWNYVGEEPDFKLKGEVRRIPILMCDIETEEIIKEFNSAKAASKELNVVNGSNITACCKGKLSSAYGYKWRYKDDRE